MVSYKVPVMDGLTLSVVDLSKLDGMRDAMRRAPLTSPHDAGSSSPTYQFSGRTAHGLQHWHALPMPPPKVLFLGANGRDTTRLRLSAEVREIREELEAADVSQGFHVLSELAVRPTDLQRLLLLHAPDVIHFSGHGIDPTAKTTPRPGDAAGGTSREFSSLVNASSSPSETFDAGLLLEDDAGAAIAVRPEVFTALVAIVDRDTPLQCVVLNACFTASQAQTIAEYVDCVVGTVRAIDDDAAIAFATGFYRAIARGKSVGMAFELGCNEIGLRGLSGQDVPQLFHRADVTPQNVFLRDVVRTHASERPTGPPPRRYEPHWAHVLEPAEHFQGRERLREELGAWLARDNEPTRIMAVCAIGGTGKTALVERVLRDRLEWLENAEKNIPGGVFVWSFCENERIDDFLDEACRYFIGETGESGGRIARLTAALKNGRPHLLVLDGLEMVQADEGGGRAKGEIVDAAFRSLVRQIAARQIGQTRLLLTSRFQLCDIASWEGDGVRTVNLEDLAPSAARDILRAWGVKGNEETLDALAERVGWHALSVRVMGSFLRSYAQGDAREGLDLDLNVMVKEASDADQKAVKLDKLLHHLAEKMSAAEREMMMHISMFHRGIGLEMLETLVNVNVSGNENGVAALAGTNQQRLQLVLRRLVAQGLAFGYGEEQQRVYTAHPFVRDYFKKIAGRKPTNVQELFRRRLQPNLELRPGSPPEDEETLDRLEALIEHTRHAGAVEEAFELYWHGMGGYKHLGPRLGEYRRARRIVEGFSPDGLPKHCALDLPGQRRTLLLNDWATLARNVGDLMIAQTCMEVSLDILRRAKDATSISVALHNIARLDFLRGHLVAMVRNANEALALGKAARDTIETSDSHGLVAFSAFMTGKVASARENFAEATRVSGEPLRAAVGLWEAKLQYHLGNHKTALEMSLANLAYCEQRRYKGVTALLYVFIGHLVLADSQAEARRYLSLASQLSSSTDHVESMIHEKDLTAAIHLREDHADLAHAAASEGLLLAETHGYGLDAIELLLTLARASLARHAPAEAFRHAKQALDRSTTPECGYVWGKADALHLMGLAHRDLGERDNAHARFKQATEVRASIEHPGAKDSREQAEDFTVIEFVKDRLRDVRARYG